jgi:hypothetical protein
LLVTRYDIEEYIFSIQICILLVYLMLIMNICKCYCKIQLHTKKQKQKKSEQNQAETKRLISGNFFELFIVLENKSVMPKV